MLKKHLRYCLVRLSIEDIRTLDEALFLDVFEGCTSS